MTAAAEMQELMHEESLKEMETIRKRAEMVLGYTSKVNMPELMAEESEKEMQTMYTRAEQVMGR